MKENSFFSSLLCHLFHGKNHAGLVICPHKGDNGGVVGHAVVKQFRIQTAFAVNRNKGDFVPFFFLKIFAQIPHSRVFHR